MKSIIKKYFSNFLFFKSHIGNKIYTQMFLSILISILDAFGLAMFLPLLEMAGNPESHLTNESSKFYFIKNIFIDYHIPFTIYTILGLLIFFFTLKGIIVYLYSIYNTNVRMLFMRNLRLKLIDSINKLSFQSFVKADVGRIQNTLTGEVERVASSYTNYFSTLQNLIFVIVYMIFAVLVDAKFALLITLGGLFTNIIFNRIYKYTKSLSEYLVKKNSSFQGFVIQFIGHFKYLKATGTIDNYSKMLKDNIFKIEKNGKTIGKLGGIVTATREPMLIIVVAAVIILQITFFGGNIANIIGSLFFFYRALSYLMTLQNYYNNFLGTSGSLNNTTSFIAQLASEKEEYGNIRFQKINSGIYIKNASFAYEPNYPILKNINITIEKNNTFAFVGESGSGKTTLVNIIAGLLSFTSGDLYLDQENIKKINLKDYRSKIGYITQESVIFNDTIYNNITFWAEKTPENLKLFRQVLLNTRLHDFIESLPDKEETYLGNNGINLSGGQKQRISIARELFKNAEILILDEATSALDSETEKEIQDNIDALKGKYTILIIAHRLSTIKNAHQIAFMDKGEIKASGDYKTLLQNSEKFRKLVELQNLT